MALCILDNDFSLRTAATHRPKVLVLQKQGFQGSESKDPEGFQREVGHVW